MWPLFRLAKRSLQPTRICVLEGGKTAAMIESQCGVRQGSVLGPALFALGLQPALTRLSNTTSSTFIAYLDDVALFAPDQRTAQKDLTATVENFKSIGLHINVEKTSVLGASEPMVVAGCTLAPASTAIIKHLGAAMFRNASDQEVSDWVAQRMRKHEKFFSSLGALQLADALLLLRVCGLGRPNFLLRTHRPEHCAAAAQWFDDQIYETLRKLLGNDVEPTNMIVQLPWKKGGLGFRSQAAVAQFAFAAAEQAADTSTNDEQQHVCAVQLDDIVEADILKKMSAEARDAFKAFERVPISRLPRMTHDSSLKQHLRERLQLPIVPPQTKCRCGAWADNRHLRCCNAATHERIARHDAVKDIVAAALGKSFSVRKEVTLLDETSRKRPDICVTLPDAELAIDVAVVYVQSDATLDYVAEAKRKKYAYLASDNIHFIPFVVGHTGEFHSQCIETLKLACKSRDEMEELQHSIKRSIFAWQGRIVRALTRVKEFTLADAFVAQTTEAQLEEAQE